MVFSLKKLEDKKNFLSVEASLAAQELEKRYESWYQERAKTIKLDGFRPGKVPVTVVKKRFSEECTHQVSKSLVDEALKKIFLEFKPNTFRSPKVEISKISLTDGFVCKFDVDCVEEFKIQPFDNLECEELQLEVEEKSVDLALENLLEKHKSFNSEQKKGKVEISDKVDILVKQNIPGQNFEPQSLTVLQLENNEVWSPLHSALVDKQKGDEFEVTINYPDNYYEASLQGKHKTYLVKIENFFSPKENKLTDEFAKEFGCEDVAGLRNKMREVLQSDQNRLIYSFHKRQVLDALDKAYTFLVPQSSVDEEFNVIWSQLTKEWAEAEKLGEKIDNGDVEKTREEYKVIAERRVRLGFLMSKIASENNINLTREEVQSAVINEASRYPNQAKQVFEYLTNNQKAIEALTAPVLEDKVINFIFEKTNRKTLKINEDQLKDKIKDILPGFGD